MNEEEIKIKYVLPWLTQTGVELHELQLERSFSVKVGRQTITVEGSGAKSVAGARLDILVRRGDKNLLIVETKALGLSLTDDDRDQAISYARLVDPIAPYAVVTNGGEYRLYNSITKQRVDPSDIRVHGFEAALPEGDIFEAQRLFLGLNRTNLFTFSREQVAGELRVVKGTVTDGKKYVPELHVPREAIRRELDEFYKSPLPGLFLVGQSGSGKTCELCSIAELLLARDKPVLFFNGSSLEKEIVEAIANEFLWTFSGSDGSIQVVKRLESFLRGESLTIIIDAIDEWTFASRSNNLASFLRAAEKEKIKVILGCKSSAVEQFLIARGEPTFTRLLTKQVAVPPFSTREFSAAVEKYRDAYGFSGAFEDAVLRQARDNPFLLRVLFDVARNLKLPHLTFNSAEFFETYYLRSLKKTSEVQLAEYTVEAIARLLYERNADWIAERDVRASLGLRITEALMEELFEFGVLLRGAGDDNEPVIGFYFQQLRDYIVAFKVLRLNRLTAASLEEEFNRAPFPSTRGDVFTLYYRLASKEHKLAFDAELRANATKYLQCYTSLIDANFPALRGTFRPGSKGRLGFIGELLLANRRVGAYGFRPIGDGDDEVYFVPVQEILGKSNLTYLSGASDLHFVGSANWFRDGIDITKEVVEGELLPQIRLFVEQGRLAESKNPGLLSEFVVETVINHKGIFGPLLTSDQRRVRYPLKLDEVSRCLLREKLARHYEGEIVKQKRKTGEIREAWNGTMVSYSYSRTPADQEEIINKVERALASGDIPTFRVRYTELEELETSLISAIDALRAAKSEIDAPLFDGRRWETSYALVTSGEEVKANLEKLYSAFLSNYKMLVETIFPTLKLHFKLYAQLPVSVYLVVGPAADRGLGYPSMPLAIYFAKTDPEESVVKVVDQVFAEQSEGGLQFTVGGRTHEGILREWTTVERVFESNFGLARDAFRGMTLRALVYSTIREELPVAEKAFRSSLRIAPPN